MKSFLDSTAKSSGDVKARRYNNSSFNNVETKRLTPAIFSNHDLDHLSLRELILLEQQYHGYLGRVQIRKDELLLKEIGDLKEKVTKLQRRKNGNLDNLEDSMNSGLFQIVGSQILESQGDSEYCCPDEASGSDGSPSLWPDVSEGSDQANQELPASKRHKPTIKQPACMEEVNGEQAKNGKSNLK